MSHALKPHKIHIIKYADVCCSKEIVDQVIDRLRSYDLFTITENGDYSEYEIFEENLLDAIEECVDDNLKEALKSLHKESDKRDGYIHFSVF